MSSASFDGRHGSGSPACPFEILPAFGKIDYQIARLKSSKDYQRLVKS